MWDMERGVVSDLVIVSATAGPPTSRRVYFAYTLDGNVKMPLAPWGDEGRLPSPEEFREWAAWVSSGYPSESPDYGIPEPCTLMAVPPGMERTFEFDPPPASSPSEYAEQRGQNARYADALQAALAVPLGSFPIAGRAGREQDAARVAQRQEERARDTYNTVWGDIPATWSPGDSPVPDFITVHTQTTLGGMLREYCRRVDLPPHVFTVILDSYQETHRLTHLGALEAAVYDAHIRLTNAGDDPLAYQGWDLPDQRSMVVRTAEGYEPPEGRVKERRQRMLDI